jgi:hypothetical protein
MKKQYVVPTVLGVSILLAAISTSFIPMQQQFASGTLIGNKPANPAGAPPPDNMTGGPSANTTGGTPSANTTGGVAGLSPSPCSGC